MTANRDRGFEAMRLMTFAALLAFAAVTAVAQDAAAQLKVAVLNTDLAIQQSEEFQSFREALRTEFGDEESGLVQLNEDIAALRQRVIDERDVMSEAELREVQKEIENKTLDLEFRDKKYRKDANDRGAEFLQTMNPKLQAVVNDLIEIERYDLVIPRQALLFANMKHDITAKVTEKLNERYAEQQGQAGG
ncbi:MAG: OmpH family outer membrane protein [Gammaproteobacteria bacterium]|nr:OmpH family outer membrane protein [Gammaproteobacteria bacterium]